MSRTLCGAFLAKIDEQIDRAAHLSALIPDGGADLASPGESNLDDLLGDQLAHLLDCMSGFCAVLYAAEPERLAHFQQLRELPVNRRIGLAEFRAHLEIYKARIAEGFALLEDSDLARNIATVFSPAGASLVSLLLGNLEHVITHKRELFESLRRMGVSLGTSDLYVFFGTVK